MGGVLQSLCRQDNIHITLAKTPAGGRSKGNLRRRRLMRGTLLLVFFLACRLAEQFEDVVYPGAAKEFALRFHALEVF